MTVAREHMVAGGRRWGTLSESFSSEANGPSVIVPISQIEGMSDTEMVSAIRCLVDEAKITGLFEWLDKWEYQFGVPMVDEESPRKLFVNLCVILGRQDEFTKSRICDLEENLRTMEMLQHQNEQIEESLSQICKLLDGAYNFLMNKRNLTPGQQRARLMILQLRNGCTLCGLLNGQHTERCLVLKRSVAGS